MLSWDATGRLEEHWGKIGGRDGLAKATGIWGSTLSAYNTGRQPLGLKNAERIAAALKVTVFDLGAPTSEQVAEQSVTVIGRLDEAEAEIARLQQRLDELLQQRGDER